MESSQPVRYLAGWTLWSRFLPPAFFLLLLVLFGAFFFFALSLGGPFMPSLPAPCLGPDFYDLPACRRCRVSGNYDNVPWKVPPTLLQ